MGMAEPTRWYEPPEPRRTEREDVQSPPAPREYRAVAMRRSELLPMAAILLMVSGLAALLIVYLTALGRMTAQGVREQQVDRHNSTMERQNEILKGRIAQGTRRTLIEQEARRLGLTAVTPNQMERVDLPPGALDAPSHSTAPTPTAKPKPRRATSKATKSAPGKRSGTHSSTGKRNPAKARTPAH